MINYYKVTNADETHYGFKYCDGLNVLIEDFNDNINQNCGKGGLYFTTLKHIRNFYSYGIYLREVFLPDNDPDFKMVSVIHKYRANKIILGKKYSLLDPKTYELFNLNIQENIYIIRFAMIHLETDFMEWWKKSNLILNASNNNFQCEFETALLNYRIDIIQWWIKNNTSVDKHIDFLNLCKKYGLELEYLDYEIDAASANGNINVLDQWKNSGLELHYSQNAIDIASENGHIIVLDWWKNSDLELHYSQNAIDTASENGHIIVLDWWKKSGLELKYSDHVIISASANRQANVLDWWKKSGLKIKISKKKMY